MALGRFLQADTIVPDPGNPQSLNRYSYTLGNPLRYTDPSGHAYCPPEANGRCIDDVPAPRQPISRPQLSTPLTSKTPVGLGETLWEPLRHAIPGVKHSLGNNSWFQIRTMLYDAEWQMGVRGEARLLGSDCALMSSSSVRAYPMGSHSPVWLEYDVSSVTPGKTTIALRTSSFGGSGDGLNVKARTQVALSINATDQPGVLRVGVSVEIPFALTMEDSISLRATPYLSYSTNLYGRRAAALAVDATAAFFAYKVAGAISAGFGVVDLVRQGTSR